MAASDSSGVNTAAWLVWLVGTCAFPLVTRNPLYLALGFLVVIVVHLSIPAAGRSGRSWRLFAYVGSVVSGFSIAFNVLTVHVGDRVFASLPGWLPIIGGRLTLNALVYGVASALAISTLLFAAATFNGAVRHADLIRLMPGPLARFGVAGAIALTFIPAIIDAGRDVYDAQRARGHRFRGPRDAPAFLGPLMTVGLERAVVLSEALETRGFGSSAGALPDRSRAVFLPALLFLLAAFPLLALGRLGFGLLAIAGAVIALVLVAPPSTARTRYRRIVWNRASVAIAVAASVAPLTVAASLAAGYSLGYEPFPRLETPEFGLVPGLAICLLVMPAIVGSRNPHMGVVPERSPHARQPLGTPAPQGPTWHGSDRSGPYRTTRLESALTIDVRELRYRFPGTARDALSGVCWSVEEGTFLLLAGDSGAGKSTLLRCLNGLIPHFHGGRFGGQVVVNGIDTRDAAPRDLARQVGAVFQDPESQIITGIVEDEIAFGLENLGVPRAEIARRIDEIVETLDIAHLRDRETSTLSGGERQIVAIAAALAPEPDILALDEPTSQLDPQAAQRVLEALHDLNDRSGMTVIIAEHRIERILPHAGQVALMISGELRSGPAATEQSELLAHGLLPPAAGLPVREQAAPGDAVLRLRDVCFTYDGAPVLDGVSATVHEGEVVALMGPNGAGKTTLLKHLIGLLRPQAGSIQVAGEDIGGLSVQEIARRTGYVPQNPTTILHREALADELAFTGQAKQIQVDIDAILESLGIAAYRDNHPLDLSGGERQRAAIAAIAAGQPDLLLLDEPTRGLPWHEKARLAGTVRRYARSGRAVFIATHDADFVRAAADRVLVLSDGKLVDDGPPERPEAGEPSPADGQTAAILTQLRAD